MAVSDAWTEAQEAVLGSVLIDPEPTVGIVMDAIRALWLERKPIDPVTVAHTAGPDYVPRIRAWMAVTPTAANVAAYCSAVKEEAQLSRLRAAAPDGRERSPESTGLIFSFASGERPR